MNTVHRLNIEADNGAEILYTCAEGCGRRVVVQRSGGFVVLDRGEFFALHAGGRGLDMSMVPGTP